MSKLLIVDHDEEFLGRTSDRLTSEGHTVETCTESNRVPSMLATGGYAMLLLDIGMPGLNAEDLLAVLRNIKSTSQTRVILWSNTDEETARTLSHKYEAEYLEKGADGALVSALVRHSFASKPPGMPG